MEPVPNRCNMSKWMDYEPVKWKPLRDIVIPMSHNSAMHTVNEAPMKERKSIMLKIAGGILKSSMKALALCQSLPIYEQLCAGVRSFDIRIMKSPKGVMYTAHSVYGPPLEEVLLAFCGFITENPSEVLFLHFRQDHGIPFIKNKLKPPGTT